MPASGLGPGDFCWLPDGRIVYARQESPDSDDGNLWQVGIDNHAGTPTGEPRRITQVAGEQPHLGWWRAGAMRALVSGWQLFSTMTLTSGSPFTIYSGIQQTGAGSNDVDRPDQVGHPVLSTSRTVREDYFGLGAANASLFSIPINVAGGTGPNHGRFGTLGRNTYKQVKRPPFAAPPRSSCGRSRNCVACNRGVHGTNDPVQRDARLARAWGATIRRSGPFWRRAIHLKSVSK